MHRLSLLLAAIAAFGLIVSPAPMSAGAASSRVSVRSAPSPNPYCQGVGALPCYSGHYTSFQHLKESIDAQLRVIGYGPGSGPRGRYALGHCTYRSYLGQPGTLALGETVNCAVIGTGALPFAAHLRVAITVTGITVLPPDASGETLVSYSYRWSS